MTCPHCHEDARFKGYRPKDLLSILGPLTVERGYYHCPSCHRGHCPGDVAFGLDRSDLTSGAAELATLAGTLDNFARAAEVILPRMSGIAIAQSTVERTTEAIGTELGRASGGSRGGARGMVAPAEARGRGGDPGVAGGAGHRGESADTAGLAGGGDLLPQSGPSDGLSQLPGQGVADRLGAGGGGLQVGDRPAHEGFGDAVGA
jgi:hypothetical protein